MYNVATTMAPGWHIVVESRTFTRTDQLATTATAVVLPYQRSLGTHAVTAGVEENNAQPSPGTARRGAVDALARAYAEQSSCLHTASTYSASALQPPNNVYSARKRSSTRFTMI